MASESKEPSEFEIKVKSTELAQDVEVDRILAAFKEDPFTLLELDVFSRPATDSRIQQAERYPTLNDIKKAYRNKSLLLHPDKCSHPKAPDAFALLKKAETDLTDEARRIELFEMVDEARAQVLRDKGLTSSSANKPSDKEMGALMRWKWRKLCEDNNNRAKILRANEVERKAKQDAERDAERKRKIDHEKQWEATRDERVNNWRSFVKTGPSKPKKQKTNAGPYPD